MSERHYVDDSTLAKIIRNHQHPELFKLVYLEYRSGFLDFFKKLGYPSELKILEGLEEAFSEFYYQVKSGWLSSKKKGNLFKRLLGEGHLVLTKGPEFDAIFNTTLKELGNPYNEANILLELIRLDDDRIFETLFDAFREPAIKVLRQLYPQSGENMLETYGTAMGILKNNVLKDKVKAPMRSTLFHYFFQILLNQFRNFLRRNKLELQGDTDWDRMKPPEEEDQQDYLDDLVIHRPALGFLPVENAAELVEFLLKEIGEPCKTYLTLFYLEELSHAQIAETMQVTEGASRIQCLRCRNRILKMVEGRLKDLNKE